MFDDAIKPKKKRVVYWTGDVGPTDDFGASIGNEFIDGRVAGRSQWACMTPTSWRVYGCGKLGEGCGQRYRKQDDGKWLKVEG